MQYSIKQVLSKASDKLNKIGINLPQLEARILLQHIINKPIEYLLINLDEQLNEVEIEAFEKLLERRLKHEPIAYITGVKEFYSREFIVNRHVLIPRSDTEVLVDVVSRCHSRIGGNPEKKRLDPRFRGDDIRETCNDEYTKILELGTGSGCIAISLLCELPDVNVIATDISLDAIEVARNNALKYHVTDRIQIIHSNWFENLGKQKFDVIVSNPPYISHSEKSEMAIETINYEPFIALFAEEDGLQAYRIIAENTKKFLKPNGKLALEIGFKQEEAVTQIFLSNGYNIESVYKDLQGHSRVILFSPINLNRSYARRIGKSLSGLQQNLLDNELPKYLFSKEKLIDEKRKIFLEIGFGMGEHFINQAKMNPNALFIGVEVYLNGVANVLKLASEQNITNFLLFPNNLDFILNDLPNNSLDGIYILFPDPWIKNKQKKKRIFNKERLKILQDKLKDNGNLVFASDIENYFYEAIELIEQNGNFKSMNKNNYLKPHDNYVITKYHQKATQANRIPRFIILQHVSGDH
ncbi:MAG: bifunctional peptide chain release factor N(5)-glutamine methyltransferase PrmC/tRNA (guanosine(46)-N7)-methyltransferase TrmB [Rickettsia endosymbiont of Glossina mortisans submortisans]|nr:bifunctional peptide chain release factor N(5)-glutamine methyltransferase PrmC/tRNA (guanosine(46)-N7)-methyltransferase TrmB [Rickettsia endosymbiont of Glossina mortisans submortisans]